MCSPPMSLVPDIANSILERLPDRSAKLGRAVWFEKLEEPVTGILACMGYVTCKARGQQELL